MKFTALAVISLLIVTASYAANVHRRSDNNAPDKFVFGGDSVNRTGFEFAVYVYSSLSECTGSLLGPEWVLTAGHCLTNYFEGDGTVITGSYDRLTADAIIYSGIQIIQHPQYDSGLLKYNIGLIRLDGVALESDNIRYVPYLSNVLSYPAGTMVTTAGWGYTKPVDRTPALHLHEVTQPLIDTRNCTDYFGSVIGGNDHCMDGAGGLGPCRHDYGAPTMTTDLMVQIGLAAFTSTQACGEADAPHGLANVAEHKDWLRTETGYPLFDPPST